MPSSPRSLRLTDAYRQRVIAIRDRVEREAVQRWTWLMPQDLDAEEWVAQVAALVAQAQVEAVRATAGYLSAYLTSETGKRQILTLDSRAYAGLSRDGRPLSESLRSPIIGTKAALKEGRPLDEALTVGLDRARRMTELDTMHASRQSLLDAIKQDDRFEGWQRALRGTCGACAGVASGVENGIHFEVHPGCQCVSEPVVSAEPTWKWTTEEQLAHYRFEMQDYGDAVPGGYNYRFQARDVNGVEVGKLDINMAGNEATIGIIEVAEGSRHQGIATKMLDFFRRYEQDVEIHPGMQTEEGAAWLRSLPQGWQERIPSWKESPGAVPRPTGKQLFDAKSKAAQDEMLGPKAAELVRTGRLELGDLVDEAKLVSDAEDFITQRPASDLGG